MRQGRRPGSYETGRKSSFVLRAIIGGEPFEQVLARGSRAENRSEIPAGHALNELKAKILTLAAEHGFDLCRFARPDVPETHAAAYEQWLTAGMHGSMDYMAEETRHRRRKQPETMLPAVKTVITLAMRYTPPPYSLAEAKAKKGRGVIAAYAHGNDYHDIMKKRLKALARDLDALLGRQDQKVYVDTAPVLEHALAESSGLGWQGKHSLTINRETGSWFLLGEIFTTADIEPDAPASSHCGSCRACMEICPTRAIVAPYVVDARLCISYLTIEFRGFIPRELRPLMGNRIFGCDDCQMVCPWNRHARAPDPDLLAPASENILPELQALFRLDEEGFRKRFRKSPVKRTGRGGLLRNIAIAMGNSGDRRYIPDLAMALDDAEPLVRAHAAWALGRLGAARELSRLEGRLQSEEHSMVREEIEFAINMLEQDVNAI